MPKGLDANVLAQTDAVQSRPVLLFEITLSESGTLRYAASQLNVTFPTGGNAYTAKAIQLSNITRRAEGQIVRAAIRFDNVAGDMAGYAAAESFDGQAISVKRIWRDAVASAAYYNEIFNGFMEEVVSIGREWLEVKVIEGKSLQRQALTPIYQKLCNHRFGDSQCNADSLADLTALTASGTADSGSATTLVDDALTQVSDYWNYGQIEIVKSGAKYRRKVKDFDAGTDTVTFDVALPVAVDNTCTYEIWKGCSQTWDSCQAINAWGPSADNKANFLGFIHIGKTMGLRDWRTG